MSKKRFSVSLEEEDYNRLHALAYARRPQLSLQYVVQYAIQQFLEGADDPQLALQLRNPLNNEEVHGR